MTKLFTLIKTPNHKCVKEHTKYMRKSLASVIKQYRKQCKDPSFKGSIKGIYMLAYIDGMTRQLNNASLDVFSLASEKDMYKELSEWV